MEDPMLEQVEAPEGGCGLWEAHAGASSWPDRWTHEEGSPRQGRFAGRTCDPVGDPTLEEFAPEVEVGDGDPCSGKDARVIDVLETTEGQVGIRASPLKKVTESVAQLKCIYTNAHSIGNKQEELEAIVQQENYDIVAITETRWDDLHNWAAAMDDYKLFRRDRQGRRGGEVALYVRECFDCLELDDGDERVECLWVFEETGFDIKDYICKEEYIELRINDQVARLYIIPGIPKNTQFNPKTRREIRVTESVAQLKCIYTNAHSIGNKQEELEAIVQQENYDIVAITETRWDDLHNWAAAMDDYKLFRRDRQGRRGGEVALYVRECFDCLELDDGDERVECLWVRIRGKANKTDTMVGVCYRPLNTAGERAN
ncbi:maestro heat-like repeat-containing protein family member 7 [Grus japonensis]|uniref:Maestro heat-like repeat-containing protein family member 7 n=1 Tax=Grus japonensis TaxID=30415 RepID=A0ABC9YIE4_GRUJA